MILKQTKLSYQWSDRDDSMHPSLTLPAAGVHAAEVSGEPGWASQDNKPRPLVRNQILLYSRPVDYWHSTCKKTQLQ